jgi:hypothetical protein
MRTLERAIWSLCVLFVAAAGCQRPGEPIGNLVGVYAIDGALTENTCGQMGLPAVDPLRFEVQIRHQNSVGYWQIEKRPAKAGELEEDGAFRFTNESTALVSSMRGANNDLEPGDFLSIEPDFDLKTTTCSLKTREVVEGSVFRSLVDEADGGPFQRDDEPDSKDDLSGENTIEVMPTAGSDCTKSLAALGGPFQNLPCTVHYSLSGVLQKSVRE